MKTFKRKILILIILTATIAASMIGADSHNNNENINKEISENLENNRTVILTDDNSKIDIQSNVATIKKYNGQGSTIVINKEIVESDFVEIDYRAFSECKNLENILIEKTIVGENFHIENFEINTNYEDEKYVQYKTTKEYSEEYQQYLELSDEEKNKIEVIPDKYYVSMSALYSESMEENYNVSQIESEAIPESFDLRDQIDIKVENQGSTGTCYAYASLTAVETNLALIHGENIDFSEVHMAALTNGHGGWFIDDTNSYYADEMGPVYESEWPMENLSTTNNEIYNYFRKTGTSLSSSVIEELRQTTAKKKIKETVNFPTIKKNGYSEYNEEDIEVLRKTIKKHIMKYGSLYASIKSGEVMEYNGSYISNALAVGADHAISIVGWDDNFSKENFPEECKPTKDGAYLVLNSLGDKWGNGGYYWISYEDFNIETGLSGVICVEDILDINLEETTINNIDTGEEILTNKIVKGANIQIEITSSVRNLIENKKEFEISVISPTKEDITDKIIITGNSIENDKANIFINLDTSGLEIGEYKIQLQYGEEKISTTIEITNDIIEGNGWYYVVKEAKLYIIENYTDKGYEYLKDDIHIIETKDTVTNLFVFQFKGYKNLKEVILSDSIKEIKKSAFQECSNLIKVVIPNGVTTIGPDAFYKCTNLTEVIISEGVASIGKSAFEDCERLKKVSLPSTLTNIEKQVFKNCISLSEITIPERITVIEDEIFSKCNSLISVKMSEGVKSFKTRAFEGCGKLANIEIPSTLISIGEGAFKDCVSLLEITIPESVTTIEYETFSNCYSLTSVKMSEEVTSFGEEAFKNCSSLKNIKIPEGVITIEGDAFRNCSSLTSIEIPKGVNTIKYLAFMGCTSLQKIIIPKGVTYIDFRVFAKCEDLTIYCRSNSTALTYAQENNIPYVIDDDEPNVGTITMKEESSEENNYTNESWTNQNIYIEVHEGSDELSGHQATTYSINAGEELVEPQRLTEEGMYEIIVTTVDKLENSAQNTYNVKIDKTNPIIQEVTLSSEEQGNKDVILTIKAVDDLSGLGEDAYSFDGGKTWQSESAKIYDKNESEIVIQVKDEAGNITTYKDTINITNIDKNKPNPGTLTMKLGDENGEDYINDTLTNKNVYILLNDGSDTESGHKSTTYTINGEEQKAKTQILSKSGTYKIRIITTDNVGNISEKEYTIKISIIIEGIEVTTYPTKTEYNAYEDFNSDGLEITAIYSNGKKETMSDYEIINGKSLTCQSSKIQIQYKGNSNIKTELALNVEHDMQEGTCIQNARCKVDGCEYIKEGSSLGHNFTDYVSNNDATCTKDGTKTAKCDRCDVTDTVTDEGSKKLHTEVIDARVEPTCTKTGLTEGKHCQACQTVIVEQQEIETLGHNYEEKITNPTCTEKGYTTYKCTRCEDSYADKYTEALNHSFTIYVPNNDATCTEDGTKTAKCDRCDVTDTKADEESRIPHEYENGTCIECGEKDPKLEITSEKYKIDDLYITKIQINTTIAQFKQNIQTNATEINVYNKQNEKQEDNNELATGMKVEFKSNNETKTLTIVVVGDVNGDGKIKLTDMTIINRHRLNKKKLEGIHLIAADVTGDGQVNFLDLVKLNRRRLNKIKEL